MWNPPWTQSVGLSGHRGSELPQAVEDAFVALGDAQRDAPESAMNEVQQALGGGVLSVMVEHIGDLTHRMADKNTMRTAGYSYVLEKVDRSLRYLGNKYGPMISRTSGFQKEHDENVRNNARSRGVPEAQYRAELNAALKKYSDEHRKLVVYNEAQWDARQAAIEIGKQDFDYVYLLLRNLKDHLGSWQEWVAYAHQYTLNPDGTPKPYKPPSRY